MAPGGMRKRLRQHTGHTEARERMGLKVVREGMFYERTTCLCLHLPSINSNGFPDSLLLVSSASSIP